MRVFEGDFGAKPLGVVGATDDVYYHDMHDGVFVDEYSDPSYGGWFDKLGKNLASATKKVLKSAGKGAEKAATGIAQTKMSSMASGVGGNTGKILQASVASIGPRPQTSSPTPAPKPVPPKPVPPTPVPPAKALSVPAQSVPNTGLDALLKDKRVLIGGGVVGVLLLVLLVRK
jgi:hypothetical protein